LVDFDTSMKPNKPTVDIVVRREAASDLGLSVGAVTQALRGLIAGQTVGNWRAPDDQSYDVKVRLAPSARESVADLERLMLTVVGPDGTPRAIRLAQIADIRPSSGPNQINRRDLARGLKRDPTPDSPLRIEGGVNFLLLALVVGVVLASGLWKSGVQIEVFGQRLSLEGLLRDAAFLVLAAISLAVTPKATRKANQFGWAPIAEVAKLFFGIFITMAPVLLMLKAGTAGAFAPLVRLVTDAQGQPVDGAYFWLTGALSSFLDNAPTYLVFFNLAGGDAQVLMTTMASTLTAISAGAVFMGANTYIGNAPNFMVKAIAEERGIAMPSFFGYMLWSGALLIPLFVAMTFIFFR
jgi:hypothetical protein